MLSDMAVERDETIFEMQRAVDNQDMEVHWLSCVVRDLVGDVHDLRRQWPVEVINLMGMMKRAW